MFHSNQLLHFYKEDYESSINSIKQYAQVLLDAAAEMKKLDLPKINPNNLRDGLFVQRVLDFYKNEWKNNTAFARVSFEKYVDFISLDYSKLSELERLYNGNKHNAFTFYKFNNKFYSYWTHNSRKGNLSFPPQVKIPYEELYEIVSGKIKVNLDEEYFKLYSMNNKQLEKVKDIETFIKTGKSLGMDYLKIKQILGNLLINIKTDLSKYEIHYRELMFKYK